MAQSKKSSSDTVDRGGVNANLCIYYTLESSCTQNHQSDVYSVRKQNGTRYTLYTGQTITEDKRVLWKESAHRLRTTVYFAESFDEPGGKMLLKCVICFSFRWYTFQNFCTQISCPLAYGVHISSKASVTAELNPVLCWTLSQATHYLEQNGISLVLSVISYGLSISNTLISDTPVSWTLFLVPLSSNQPWLFQTFITV